MPYAFKLSHRLSRYRMVALMTMLGIGACTSTDASLTSPTASQDSARNTRTVTVSPSALSGSIGQSGQLTAVVKNQYGQVMTGAIVTWSSDNTSVVTVNGSGLATAVGAGSATITATSSGYRGTAAITVSGGTTAAAPATVSDLAVAATTDSSVTLSFTEVNDGTGAAASYEVRLAPGTLSWGSAAPVVSGSCSTPLAGTTIGTKRSCTVGGLTAATSYQFQVVAFRGTLNQNAVFGALSNVATGLTIAQALVGAVTLSPTSVSGAVGQTGQFTATVTDPSGAAMTGQKVSWASSSNAVVTIDSTGWATATGAGSATITASCGGKSGTAAVVVTGGTAGVPATITISPSSASVLVGASQLFTATVKDASGTVLTGQTVTFTSSNTLVGTIGGSSGIVTALAAGSTTITATDGALQATASLAVSATQPPPPPPSGGNYPNAPSSFPVLSQNPFDQLNENGWQVIWNTSGYGSIVSDPTAPASPSNVLQIMYPAGFAGGTAPATEITELNGANHFYSGIWWKPSNPWQGHSSNVNKIQFIYFNTGGGDMALEMYGNPGGPYHIQVCMQFMGTGVDSRCWLTPNVNNTAVTLGQWHQIEWYVDVPSHTMKWWMDGQLIANYTDVLYPTVGMNEYKISPTWGGIGDTKAETDYYWFDDVVVRGY